jgi:hypothetical protein
MWAWQRAKAGVAGRGLFKAALTLALTVALFAPQTASARHRATHHSTRHAKAPANWANVSLTDPNKDAALIIDGVSGRVL